jgi:hypothetical protein
MAPVVRSNTGKQNPTWTKQQQTRHGKKNPITENSAGVSEKKEFL